MPDSINVSVHAWSSEAGALDDVAVVFDPAIPPDEPMGGGRIGGIGEGKPQSEDDIARAADMLTDPTMESTARLTVRVDVTLANEGSGADRWSWRSVSPTSKRATS